MKKVRIPFSLNEYNKGSYEVETRGDKYTKPKKVRIICTNRKAKIYPIVALIESNGIEDTLTFTLDGCKYANDQKTKCDLFLVKQEFEDGDIVYASANNSIQRIIFIYGDKHRPCVIFGINNDKVWEYSDDSGWSYDTLRLATEDEKKKLFDALSIKGKCWNAEKKCIEDIKPKYTFEPTEWCLMRTASNYAWCLGQFSNMDLESYVAIGGAIHKYCIPYNDKTKHLLGTTEDAPEKYKTW